ncbi:hypothetical protein B0H10DRAFT_2213887 [Mycena sp. CBHHK59/15]|nr:hypothetical protein B0H10DRAFT_2213887 [Mycena sp. CBHHK59/15]
MEYWTKNRLKTSDFTLPPEARPRTGERRDDADGVGAELTYCGSTAENRHGREHGRPRTRERMDDTDREGAELTSCTGTAENTHGREHGRPRTRERMDDADGEGAELTRCGGTAENAHGREHMSGGTTRTEGAQNSQAAEARPRTRERRDDVDGGGAELTGCGGTAENA